MNLTVIGIVQLCVDMLQNKSMEICEHHISCVVFMEICAHPVFHAATWLCGLCLKVQVGVREIVCGGARQGSLCCVKDCYTESLFASVVGGNVCVARLDKFKCTSVTHVKELHLKIFPVHGVRR